MMIMMTITGKALNVLRATTATATTTTQHECSALAAGDESRRTLWSRTHQLHLRQRSNDCATRTKTRGRRAKIYCHHKGNHLLLSNAVLASIMLFGCLQQSAFLLSVRAQGSGPISSNNERHGSALATRSPDGDFFAGGGGAAEQEEELRISAGDDLSRPQHATSRLARKRATGDDPALANDPFAFTFEDYLREASRTNEHRPGASLSSSSSAGSRAAGAALEGASEMQNELTIGRGLSEEEPSDSRRAVVEIGEDVEMPASNSMVDFKLPGAEGQHELGGEGSRSNTSSSNGGSGDSSAANELGLLYAWRSLPTNKCSRECGRGFRVNHLSCMDLKHSVLVEDELCLRARLARPSAVNLDEPCNELDCSPQWSSTELKHCDQGPDSAGPSTCRPVVFKRVECVQVDARGQARHLDESHCANQSRPNETASLESAASSQAARSNPSSSHPPTGESDSTNEFTIHLDDLLDKERNEILNSIDSQDGARAAPEANRWAHSSHRPFQRQQHSGGGAPPSGEPFYEPGEWSECAGAPCGQLGARSRNLTCRLYLARSAKFVDLPHSSCAALAVQAPHRNEPCYMDCGPGAADTIVVAAPSPIERPEPSSGAGLDNKPPLVGSVTNRSHDDEVELGEEEENENEVVYELDDAQRFVWRHHGWTKCSAECLGGRSESLLECWDKVAEQAADAARCQHLKRPRALLQSCNEIPCAPEWRLEPFGNCSRSCGSAGVRTRSIACVQLVPLHAGQSSYMLVSHDLCLQAAGDSAQVPHTMEPCNRVDCPPEWSLGPWSECRCDGSEPGGVRNRTIICVQEFATREGPAHSTSAATNRATTLSDIQEALRYSAMSWHPGKSTQVPTSECFDRHKMVPSLSERCSPPTGRCAAEQRLDPIGHFIDSDASQDYRATGVPDSSNGRRRSITLKVGGRARLPEGRNLKIRCRVLAQTMMSAAEAAASRPHRRLVNAKIDWFKDGVRMFAPNSSHKTFELQQVPLDETLEEDNSILASDVLVPPSSADQLMLSDQPPQAQHADQAQRHPRAPHQQPKAAAARKLSVRSSSALSFRFVAQPKGRFSLVKEDTLKIKRLKPDDSGVYTCQVGQLSESLELSVVSKRQQFAEVQHQNHQQQTSGSEANSY